MIKRDRPVFAYATTAIAFALAGCSVGPDYRKPVVDAPTQWSEAAASDPLWQAATPGDTWPRGEWWTIFADPQLNALQQQASTGNFDLQVALARLEQAQATAQITNAAALPGAELDGSSTRTRTSANRANTGTSNSVSSTLRNNNKLALAVDYEVDLFGRVRRELAAGQAGVERAAADLENVRLLLAAEVAINYFSVRSLESELAVIDQTIAVQGRLLDVVQARHADGLAHGMDLAQQELIVSTDRSQRQQLLLQYQQKRHVLATLLGVTAENLQLTITPLPLETPPIPTLLPADLLQRRPDIASAERAVAIANAQIGVARAGRFPRLLIGASDGFESSDIGTLLNAPSAAWSIGATLSQSIFDGGRNRGRENFAIAAHRQATAEYRQTVLSAWQEVEDHLAGLRALSAARIDARQASRAAQQVADIAEDRYQAGIASAIERYTAQQTALATRRQEQQLGGQQWVATVLLVKALGGGWDAANAPVASLPATPE